MSEKNKSVILRVTFNLNVSLLQFNYTNKYWVILINMYISKGYGLVFNLLFIVNTFNV